MEDTKEFHWYNREMMGGCYSQMRHGRVTENPMERVETMRESWVDQPPQISYTVNSAGQFWKINYILQM